MALINCPKCSGIVSTKAPACPHCGSIHSDQDPGNDLEKLADQLGSRSAAVADLDTRQPPPADAVNSPEESAEGSFAHNFVWSFVVFAIIGYKLTTVWISWAK